MIIPPNTRFRLAAEDEYPHQPEAASNYNESMYFSAFDVRSGIGAWMRIGNRPNEGHAEVTCCVYLPDGSVGFMYGRHRIDGNVAMEAGGLKFEMLEPFKRMKVSYDGELLIMKDPLSMVNPSSAFKSNPKVAATIRLDFEGISPMYGGELVSLDGSPLDLDPEQSVFRAHTEQNMAVRGSIEVGGVSHAVDGFGYRDKSWGPRHWHNFFWYRWLSITFSRNFGLLLSINGRRGQDPHISGNLLLDGRYEPIRAIDMQTEWDDQNYPTAITAQFETDDAHYTLEGRIRSLVPLRHKTPPGADPNVYTRITEGIGEFRCEGHRTLAVAEYNDLMVGGVPVSRNAKTSGRAEH